MEVLFIWLVFATFCGWVTHHRGNGFTGGFLISLIFSPLIGFLYATKEKDTVKPPPTAVPSHGRSVRDVAKAHGTDFSKVADQQNHIDALTGKRTEPD